jgi:hypothetical protein
MASGEAALAAVQHFGLGLVMSSEQMVEIVNSQGRASYLPRS